jgi:hypothetical protein
VDTWGQASADGASTSSAPVSAVVIRYELSMVSDLPVQPTFGCRPFSMLPTPAVAIAVARTASSASSVARTAGHCSASEARQKCRSPSVTRRARVPSSTAARTRVGIGPVGNRSSTCVATSLAGVAAMAANCCSKIASSGPSGGFGVSRSGV